MLNFAVAYEGGDSRGWCHITLSLARSHLKAPNGRGQWNVGVVQTLNNSWKALQKTTHAKGVGFFKFSHSSLYGLGLMHSFETL